MDEISDHVDQRLPPRPKKIRHKLSSSLVISRRVRRVNGMTLMTKPARNGRFPTTQQPRPARRTGTRSVRSLCCLHAIGAFALHKAERKSFARPGTSANCVIARLHPQLSHLAEMGYKASPMAESNIYSRPCAWCLFHPQNAAVDNSVSFAKPPEQFKPSSFFPESICTSHLENAPATLQDVVTALRQQGAISSISNDSK